MIFGPQKITVWVVASHNVGEAIEADLHVTEAEAVAAFESIDDPLMDCKRMFTFDLEASIGWGVKQG